MILIKKNYTIFPRFFSLLCMIIFSCWSSCSHRLLLHHERTCTLFPVIVKTSQREIFNFPLCIFHSSAFFMSCCLMHIWASTIFYGSRDAPNLVIFRDIHYYSVILILVERLGSLINPQRSLPSCCTLTNPKTPFEIGLEMKIGAEMDQNRPTDRTATV